MAQQQSLNKNSTALIITPLHDFLVYVILGPYHEHIGLLVAMEDRHLFDQGTSSYCLHF